MKMILTGIAVMLLLAGCSSMRPASGGASDVQGTVNYDNDSTPYVFRPFNPENVYHGG